jgi:RimJ/RimL family protein N-acetyltransferase
MEISLIGETTVLRQAKLDDSLFISQLRSDPKVYEFLSSSSPITLEQQKAWLKKYIDSKDGYYFIIDNPLLYKSVGTISIYNVNNGKQEAELGRYISVNSVNAIEAEYLLLDFCFNIMHLESVYCKTADKNIKVWKQHLSFGFQNVGFEEFSGKNIMLRRQTITRAEFLNFDYSKIFSLINRFKNS